MKISIIGEGPFVATGFSTVGRQLAKGFSRLGHDVNFLSFQHFGEILTVFDNDYDFKTTFGNLKNGYKLYPCDKSEFGINTFIPFLKKTKPDILITYFDLWSKPMAFLVDNNISKYYKWIHYASIDSSPIPASLYNNISAPQVLLSMSKYGQSEFKKYNYSTDFIWLGVDTKLFIPRPELKLTSQYNGKFVVLFASRNNLRKEPEKFLRAIKIISKKYPDKYKNMVFHMHTDMNDLEGLPLLDIIRQLGIQDKVFKTANYNDVFDPLNREDLAKLYSLANIHVLPTGAEGFGLTIAETMACGIPTVMTNCSTGPELLHNEVGVSGRLAKVKEKIVGAIGSYLCLVDANDLAENIMFYYDNENERKRHGMNGRIFTERYLDWDDCIIPKWLKMFDTDNYRQPMVEIT